MLKWYKITGPSPTALDNIAKDIRNGRMLVRRHNGDLFACVSTHHQGWLSKICTDFSGALKVLDTGPANFRHPTKDEYMVPCGEKFYDPILCSQHIRRCKKCIELKKAPPAEAAHATTAKIKTKIEPGMDFNLDGIIASVELTRDRLYEQIETVDNLLKNLKGFRDAKEAISTLETEVKERREALRLFAAAGKL